jgi:exodeoxyribonuclease V alpha subunit
MDTRFGEQFRVEQVQFEQPAASDGLADYLARSPRFVGIGPRRAQRVVERFGDRFEQVLLTQPDSLLEVLPAASVEVLRREWVQTRDLNQAMVWLAGCGLTPHQIATVVEAFGAQSVSDLRKNPYALIGSAAGFGFKRVDEIALRIGTPKESPTRLGAAVEYAVREQASQGHCWTELTELVEVAVQILFLDTQKARPLVEQHVHRLLDEKVLACFCISSRVLVGQPSLLEDERFLYERFVRGAAANPSVGALSMHPPAELNARQGEAFVAAMKHNMVVISGSAGAGKTFTQRAIAEAYLAGGLTVELCAPTGKAAKHLEQVVERPARTIHRLLEFNGEGFTRDVDNPLACDVLIVDEVSMVDVALAAALFRAVDPERTAVVLVGDHHQLPPVGAGNLLRDLIERRFLPTVVLDQVVRQAGTLKTNSLKVLSGHVAPTQPLVESKSPWVVIPTLTQAEEVAKYLLNLFEQVLQERLGFELLQDVQLLTPKRDGPLGVDELNRALQRLVQRKLWKVAVPEVSPGKRPPFLLSDKVIQTRNSYALGVMNGSVGTVTQVDHGDLRVQFEDKVVVYKAAEKTQQHLELAYALTIHKFQGSEVKCAVVVMHKSHAFMHHRNLLYTAITRARQMVIVVGDHWGIRHCAQSEQVDKRRTFLSLLVDDGDLE